MKIILGNEEIKKIIEGYAYSEFPAKEPEVIITNKRNGVEISINLSEPKNGSRSGSTQSYEEHLSEEEEDNS